MFCLLVESPKNRPWTWGDFLIDCLGLASTEHCLGLASTEGIGDQPQQPENRWGSTSTAGFSTKDIKFSTADQLLFIKLICKMG